MPFKSYQFYMILYNPITFCSPFYPLHKLFIYISPSFVQYDHIHFLFKTPPVFIYLSIFSIPFYTFPFLNSAYNNFLTIKLYQNTKNLWIFQPYIFSKLTSVFDRVNIPPPLYLPVFGVWRAYIVILQNDCFLIILYDA